MSKLDVLVTKINEDTEKRKEIILKEAENQASKIIKNKEDIANEIKEQIINKANEDAEILKEKIYDEANFKSKNITIAIKNKIIDDILEEAINEMSSMGKNEYIGFITGTILSLDISGDETLFLNKTGAIKFSEEDLNNLNQKLTEQGKKGEIKIQTSQRDFRGGFILGKGNISYIYTFESIVDSNKQMLEIEIAKQLFG